MRIRHFLRNIDGSNIIELALVLPIFVLILGTTVELGRAWFMGIELASAAHAGALYGIHSPTDVTGMVTTTQTLGSSIPGFTASAKYGCECADGTSSIDSCSDIPSCTNNYVNYVDVVASASYTPVFSMWGIPATRVFSSEARLRVGGD